jgi:hypothetical protein
MSEQRPLVFLPPQSCTTLLRACRSVVKKRTPKLLPLWDQEAKALMVDSFAYQEALRQNSLAHAKEFEKGILERVHVLERILVRPGSAKPARGIDGKALVDAYDGIREVLAKCKELSKAKRVIPYSPDRPPWGNNKGSFALRAILRLGNKREHLPKRAVKTGPNEKDLYQQALEYILGVKPLPELLDDCYSDRDRPAEAALTVLSRLTEKTPGYLRKRISDIRQRG